MPLTALALFALYLALAFGARTWLQRRRTGSTGFKGISGRPGSREWTAGAMFAVALLGGLAAPVLGLLDLLEPIALLDGSPGHAAGLGLFAGGLLTTLVAQSTMGLSWRIGVDPAERLEMVTQGPFAVVRNPIFTGMAFVSGGLAFLVPNALAVCALIALVLALELQTRWVEEPYLLRTHGLSYRAYATRVGRFLPLVGRLRGRDSPTRQGEARSDQVPDPRDDRAVRPALPLEEHVLKPAVGSRVGSAHGTPARAAPLPQTSVRPPARTRCWPRPRSPA